MSDLPDPVARRPVHTRRISFEGFLREDDLWDIDCTLSDTKSVPIPMRERGVLPAGEPIHHMRVRLTVDDTLTIRTRITNAGTREGEEVVQLYLRDRTASRVRPVRELKRFRKITLAAGESQDVEFTLTRADVEFHGVDNRPVAEPGLFDLWVAPSSAVGEAMSFELLPR